MSDQDRIKRLEELLCRYHIATVDIVNAVNNENPDGIALAIHALRCIALEAQPLIEA